MSTNYSLTSIFCDDIRHEINGKMSLMGIYSGDMYVPDFPITLPKICAFFELRSPLNIPSSTDVRLTVIKGTEKINSITLTIPPTNTESISPHGKPFAYFRTLGGMEFPSMTFAEPVLIEVVAEVDGQSIIGGRLWVSKFPQGVEAGSPTPTKKSNKRS